ncbi:molybdenum cofactor synthesis protein, partial [bacterium]|nr:molybdenum cofactor synthesis protein [candidate division CSSED10-310 bacterium]
CHPVYERHIIPDDPELLRQSLQSADLAKTDLVVTTGGTGIGPRDFTPEVTQEFVTRPLLGLMEHIRRKYGMDNPGAMLSRGIAGCRGTVFIINVPGSVRGAVEYINELLLVWDHIHRMVHAIDVH